MTIYHGDCREILPDLPVADLLLTDPPYGIGEAKNKNRFHPFKGKGAEFRGGPVAVRDYGSSDWDDKPAPTDLLKLARSRARWQIIFGGNYFELPPNRCWLVWDKRNGACHFADCELAWTNLDKAVRMISYRWHGMLQAIKEDRWHPTQKPLAVMRWCIQQAPDVKTIVDPFMGSGTTLRAAKDLGLTAVGVDAEERYCEIAAKRLSQGVLPLQNLSNVNDAVAPGLVAPHADDVQP